MATEAQQPRVELFFRAHNLVNKDIGSKSDPFLVLYSKDDRGSWVEVGRTATIQDQLNPVWIDRFVVDYHFERVQEFKLVIYDEDAKGVKNDLSRHDLLGENTFKLASVMAARGQQMTIQLVKAKQGTVTIRGEPATSSRDTIVLELAAAGLPNKSLFSCIRTSSPFVTASREREDKSWLQVWKSEVVQEELNPRWPVVELSLDMLCNGDLDRPMKFEMYDQQDGEEVLMGWVFTTIRELSGNPGRSFTVQQPPAGCFGLASLWASESTFICRQAQIKRVPTFTQYIKGGCQISLMVAIDFTASNGDPNDTRSLHYMDPKGEKLNEYQHAIVSVGRVLDEYDSDKKYPVYGFGAKLKKNPETVSHCFYVCRKGEKEALEVEGVQGILDAYKTCRNEVTLSGPTKFGPVLRAAIARAQHPVTQTDQHYHVLLIICDGAIHDMPESIEAIVEASRLPMSVIIVGVGNADFSAMNALDSDDKLLKTAKGATTARDIVQFVPFRKHADNPERLAREVLAEIPAQLMGFMAHAGIAPNTPDAMALSVEESKSA